MTQVAVDIFIENKLSTSPEWVPKVLAASMGEELENDIQSEVCGLLLIYLLDVALRRDLEHLELKRRDEAHKLGEVFFLLELNQLIPAGCIGLVTPMRLTDIDDELLIIVLLGKNPMAPPRLERLERNLALLGNLRIVPIFLNLPETVPKLRDPCEDEIHRELLVHKNLLP